VQAIAAGSVLITALSDLDKTTPFRVLVAMSGISAGRAICHMPGITTEALANHVRGVEYEAIERRAAWLKHKLDAGGVLEVVTQREARGRAEQAILRIELPKSAACVCDGSFENGSIGNLPAGECYVPLDAPEANGRLILDGSFLDTPIARGASIILVFSKGYLINIEAKTRDQQHTADALIKRIDGKDGRLQSPLAEVALGLNPSITSLSGSELVDEKAIHTGHIAVGQAIPVRQQDIGDAPHCDLVFREPSFILNGVEIVRRGRPMMEGA
jgi:leucyl aminopeptidase (aminopeptidase T)